MGGQKYEDVEKTKVECTVLPGIECYGPRTFLKEGFPCVKYSTYIHHFNLSFLIWDFCLDILDITLQQHWYTASSLDFWELTDSALVRPERQLGSYLH